MAGRFISFEGGEGSGKSTQARLLAEHLRNAGHDVVLTREPGGTPGAEAVRALLVTGAVDRWNAWSETCLLNAARADHLERVVLPALARGAWVVTDRYVDSTRAYQGAKGLADADILALHRLACGDIWTDLTIVLTLDPLTGLARARARGDGEQRFESHGGDFHARVTGFFNALPAAEPERCRGFAADQSIESLAAAIAATVRL